MSEEEKDILFDIDMQLYNEFNDTIASMYDHLGEIYTLKDIEEVEKAEKEKEIKLLRGAIKELQKELEEKTTILMTGADKVKQLEKENAELKKDISNMYDKEVIISVMCDNFDITRIEALEMLGEEE